MNFIKRRFHSDLTIRYEQQINKGTMCVTKRQDSGLLAFMLWGLKIFIKENKLLGFIFLFYNLLIISVFLFDMVGEHYSERCEIEWLGCDVSIDLFVTSGISLSVLIFLPLLVIIIIIYLKSKSKKFGQWQIDHRASNRFYIVEKKRSQRFAMLQRVLVGLLIGILLILSIKLVWFFGDASFRALSKHGYSLSSVNNAWIKDCKANQ